MNPRSITNTPPQTAQLGIRARALLLSIVSLSAIAGPLAPASAQNLNPYEFKKEAFKPNGTPWSGPVQVGDIIKYVLSYKPGTTNSGPVTIDDTLSPNLVYVPPTKASDSGWTWGALPYSIGHHELYKHPGFGPNTGSVKVTVTGQPLPVQGTGDGTIPIPVLNKVFGVFHHASAPAEGKVDCWDLITLAKCGSAQPNATSGFIYTPYTPHSVVRGTNIYFIGYLANFTVTIGCFNAAAQSACADIPLPDTVADKGELAGLVEDSTGRVFAAVKNKVYCRMLPAGTNCAGWPAAGLVSITAATSPTYSVNVLYVAMEYGPSPTRLYIHHGDAVIQCIDVNLLVPCPGSWTPAGTKITGQNEGIMLSSFPLSGSSGDGGVCLWKKVGAQVGCLTNTGAPIAVTPTNVSNPALSAFRLPNSGKVFFPSHAFGVGPKCFDYSGTTGSPCYAPPIPPPNGLQYGFALDPRDPARCMLTLGDKNVLWRFNYITGKTADCAPPVTTPDIKDIYCNGEPTLSTFRWTTIRAITPGAKGTLTITKGTGAPVTLAFNTNAAYPIPPGIGPGYGQLSFTYVPDAGTQATVEFEIGFTSDKNPQICYQARVTKCGPVFNTAVFKGNFNGSAVNVSQKIDLGNAIGPDCPELTQCLKDSQVTVKCNPDGTFTVTLVTAGFTGTDITLTSETPGVTVTPPQQPWAATTTWILTGATPGQAVTLYANETKAGAGSTPDTDLCCSGEIKIVMPECKKPIDLTIGKENTAEGGSGTWFNLWVTNVGAPITFPAGGLTVTDAIPAGMTVSSVAGPNWSCTPPIPPAMTGPASLTCHYNLAGSLATNAGISDSIIVHYTTTGPGPFTNCATVSASAAVGVDTNPANNTACVTVSPSNPGSLIVKKEVIYEGPIALPSLSYPVTVTCGGNVTNLNLINGVPQTVGNIPLNTVCSVVEGTVATPPNFCPPRTTPVWSTVYLPPSPITITGPGVTEIVRNTLVCRREQICPPPMVPGPVAGQCICPPPSHLVGNVCEGPPPPPPPPPPPSCQPPMVPGPVAGQCICGPGTVLVGRECVKQTICQPPMVPGPVAGQCICGPGTMQVGRECVKQPPPPPPPPPPPSCKPPMVPGPVAGQCICPPPTVLKGRECVRPIVCRPPQVPNPAGTDCSCPQGTVQRGNECIKQPVCNPPAKLNRSGACECPTDMVARGSSCIPRERPRPQISPGDIIRNLPGGGRDTESPRGGQGPADTPGKR